MSAKLYLFVLEGCGACQQLKDDTIPYLNSLNQYEAMKDVISSFHLVQVDSKSPLKKFRKTSSVPELVVVDERSNNMVSLVGTTEIKKFTSKLAQGARLGFYY